MRQWISSHNKLTERQARRRVLGLRMGLRSLLTGCIAFLSLGCLISAAGQSVPDGLLIKSTDSGATWTAINTGITCRFVFTLVPEPGSPSVVYAGTDRGVFKTTNGGKRWVQSTGLITLFNIGTIAIDPVNHSTVYAGGLSNSPQGGVFKSEDGGLNWRPINAGLATVQINGVEITPDNPSVLYANDELRVYKSVDGGKQWFTVLSFPDTGDIGFQSILKLDPFSPTTLYVTGSGRFYRSTDGGGSWLDITERAAQASGGTSLIDFKLDPISPSVIYTTAFSAMPVTSPLPIKTTDGGETWARISDEQSFRMGRVVAASAAPPVLYSMTNGALLKSTDRGDTWAQTGTFPPWPSFLAVDPGSASTLYEATSMGNPPTDKPWMRSFQFDGNRLIIYGEYFDVGAVILLDGQEQGTINNPLSPNGSLIGKKAGKKVRKHPKAKIQVRNANGSLSQEVTIWPPLD